MVKYKVIRLPESIYNRIVLDKKHFQETIKIPFTMGDTINEYHKILNSLKNERKK